MNPTVFRAVVHALLGHWRRNPLQLAALLVGLAIATALWSGVQALNAEAKASYDRASAQIAGGGPRLVPVGAATIDQADWAALRRAGHQVSPVVEGAVTLPGASARLIGIDMLDATAATLITGDLGVTPGAGDATLADFLLPPFRTLAAAETLSALGLDTGETPATAAGATLPPLASQPGLPEGLLLVDIAAAQGLLGMEGRLSYLMVGPRAAPGPLTVVTGTRLKRVEPETPEDLQRLTRSFHLNLTAFGLLSFVVGLFIVHAAIGLAFEQRRAMFRTLRATGVSARALTIALLGEVLLLALLAGAAGLVGGYLIAALLLPDVSATVGGLYGAEVPGTLSFRPVWFAAGLAMAVIGALAAAAQSLWRAYTMTILESALPQAWAAGQRRWLWRQGAAAAAVALVGLALPPLLGGLLAGFAMMAALVVAAALALPLVLAGALALAEHRAAPGLSRWFWADSRQQLSGLSLALMALLLALAVNVGVGTMVGSFRLTFTTWLEDRLAADAYFRADTPAEASAMTDWLTAQPETRRVLPNWHVDTRVEGWPVEVYGFADDALYRSRWPLLSAAPDVWDTVAEGQGVLISEQLAYRFDLGPGDRIAVPSEIGLWTVPVAGIYPDYGNPRGQVRVNVGQLTERWPSVERLAFGLLTEEGARQVLLARFIEAFDLGPNKIQDQAGIRALSLRIFDRTFIVTGALNSLTLGVAGIALLTSLVTLAGLRLPQLAPVWAIGVTRRTLALTELAKMMALAMVTALAALPLGLGIAWLLLSVINVA
ncbi:MAG: FtsX-like permease family protein, partial [Pseudomonadota bacterium]